MSRVTCHILFFCFFDKVVKLIGGGSSFSAYLEYIVTIHFIGPYQNLLTLYVQYTKTKAV